MTDADDQAHATKTQDHTQLQVPNDARILALYAAVLGAALLALGRLIATVQLPRLDFTGGLVLWGTFILSLGLIVSGLVGVVRSPSEPKHVDMGVLLTGMLILALTSGFGMFSSMF